MTDRKPTPEDFVHRVTLSNGRVLLIEERPARINIATEDDRPFQPYMYVAWIEDLNVGAPTNSGPATTLLVEGLTGYKETTDE